MPGASSKMSDPITDETGLDALFAQLMAPAAQGTGSVGADKLGTKAKAPKARSVRAERKLPEDDPWKELSDQVNDEISRQIYDELDKQLDAQIMAELEKCQDEQSRRMDEELDRQLQEQLDAMLEASLEGENQDDEQDGYEYLSDSYTDYSTDDEEYYLENLRWSEGGEGGIGYLGLQEFIIEDGAATGRSNPEAMFGTPRYTEEELQKMLDVLYGEGGRGKISRPGAWGKAKWRPSEGKSGSK